MAVQNIDGLDYLVLEEGARIAIKSTVHESSERKLIESSKVVTDADGKRSVTARFAYPFPMGLVSDFITKKPPLEASPKHIANAIAQWLEAKKVFVQCEGRVCYTKPNGVVVKGQMPIKYWPELGGEDGMLAKGFKLSVQGPANLKLQSDFVLKTNGTKPRQSKGTDFSDVEELG